MHQGKKARFNRAYFEIEALQGDAAALVCNVVFAVQYRRAFVWVKSLANRPSDEPFSRRRQMSQSLSSRGQARVAMAITSSLGSRAGFSLDVATATAPAAAATNAAAVAPSEARAHANAATSLSIPRVQVKHNERSIMVARRLQKRRCEKTRALALIGFLCFNSALNLLAS